MPYPSQTRSAGQNDQRCIYDCRQGATIEKAAREIGLGKDTTVFIHPENESAVVEFVDSLRGARRMTWIALGLWAAAVAALAVLKKDLSFIYLASLLLAALFAAYPAPSSDTILMMGMVRARRVLRWIVGAVGLVLLIVIAARALFSG